MRQPPQGAAHKLALERRQALNHSRAGIETKAAFIKPMLLLQTERLPEGSKWALAIKTGGKVHLLSRNDNDFNLRYPAVVRVLAALPDETVIDGEVVALD